MLAANGLVQVSGCVPDIICVAQIILKFVDHALIVYNWGLFLFRGDDLADLLNRQKQFLKQFSVLRKCRSKFDRLIFEMLFIKELKPGLNTQDSVTAKLST